MVVVHYSAWKCEQYSLNPIEWYTFGGAGVDLFFIISGYIMCLVSYERETTFKSFMMARLNRIIPIYWLLSFAALCAYITVPHLVNSGGGNTNVISSFLLLPTDDKYLIQNGWTLRYEFLFYLIFAFVLNFAHDSKHLQVTLAIIAGLILSGSLIEEKNYISNFFLSELLGEFALGMLAYKLFSYIRLISLLVAISLMIIGVTLLVIATPLIDVGYSRLLVWGLPMLIIFVAIRGIEDLPQSIWDSSLGRLLILIGDSSYSLYLIHPFSLVATAILLKGAGLAGNPLVFGFFLIAASLVSGYLCYKYLEKPLIKLKSH